MDLLTTVYLIIDAGGTFLKSAILNAEGEVLEGSSFSVESCSEGSKTQILSSFYQCIAAGINYIDLNKCELKGIGIGFPGPFNFKEGIPLLKHKFAAIYGIELTEEFRQITGISKAIPIGFIHDVNAVLEGELANGKANGFQNVALVTLGTGIGFSYALNGQVQCNSMGSPAVSLYKQAYKNGIVEDYVSKQGIINLYHKLGGNAAINNVAKIATLAKLSDDLSIKTFHTLGKILAKSINAQLEQHQIECLLLGGQISQSFHLFEASLKENLQQVKSLRKVECVSNIHTAGLSGILFGLLCEMREKPL